jgi:hypothetical protein
MLSKSIFVLAAFVVCFAFVQGSLEDEYPNVELPGLAVPQDDDSQENDDPKPCCFPEKWQGNVTSQAGVSNGRRSKFGHSSSLVFVDGTSGSQRIAGRGAAGRFGNETGGFIVLFKPNKTAELYLFKFGQPKCWHKTLNRAEFRPQCIPANATLSGEFSLGPASGGLQVQSWAFRGRSQGRRGSVSFVGGKIVVVPSGCVPVLIQDHGIIGSRPRPGSETNEIKFEQADESESMEESEDVDRRPGRRGRGKGFVASVYFSNIKPTIDDPAVFTPPTYCNATASTDNSMMFDGEPMPEVLERFISY